MLGAENQWPGLICMLPPRVWEVKRAEDYAAFVVELKGCFASEHPASNGGQKAAKMQWGASLKKQRWPVLGRVAGAGFRNHRPSFLGCASAVGILSIGEVQEAVCFIGLGG